MHRQWTIWIGFDPRESAAFAVARESIRRHLSEIIPVHGVVLSRLQSLGLYTRPTERRMGRLYDPISRRDDYDGSMATEFAIARFLVPHLAGTGLAMFMDCDMLCRSDPAEVFNHCERQGKAVYCVKHHHVPDATEKMDGQLQTRYARKNWSSVMVFDCDHPGNESLTLDLVNTVPGRDLHAFCWLNDEDIGELEESWNWLAGHSDPTINPKMVHHTDGSPCMTAFANAPFADEWRECLAKWAM